MFNRDKIKKHAVKGLACLLAALMLIPGFASAAAPSDSGSGAYQSASLAELLSTKSYSEYILQYDTIPYGTSTTVISGEDILNYNADITNPGDTPEKLKAYEFDGVTGLYLPNDSVVGWNISIPAEGMYTIEIRYLAVDEEDSKTTSIERTLYINQKVPFYEARFFSMSKSWIDKQSSFQSDEEGNVIYKFQKDGSVDYPYVNAAGEVLEFKITGEGKISFVKTGATVNESELTAAGYVKYPVYNNDINRNEIKSDKQLLQEWKDYICTDSTGYFIDPLLFHFKEGSNTIQLEAQREAMVIASITVKPYEKYQSYSDYLSYWTSKGATAVSEGSCKVQAEYPSATSENTIYATNDRTSYITEPQDASTILLNVIGGDGGEKWQTVGQWVRYNVTVPKTGFYQITLRYRQSVNQGTFSSRTVKVATASMLKAGQSAVTPFYEAQYAQFNYSDDWQTGALGDGETTFSFYLEEGENVIELHASLGLMAEILRRLDETLETVNSIYLKILMITGTDPDANRDYGFYSIMPDDIDELLVQSDELYAIADEIEAMTGTTGSNVATLRKIALLLYRMGFKEDNIAKNLTNLKDNLGTLGTWIQEANYQPLEIDYVVVEPTDVDVKKAHVANDNFFQAIWFEVIQFVRSFVSDYNTLGAMEVVADENVVEVWTTLGRDQAQIIRNLINSDFNKNNPGISVELKLVAGGALLPSVLAGVGPDISMGHGSGDVINWAIRSAVQPLNYALSYDKSNPDYDPETEAWYNEVFTGLDEVVGTYDLQNGFSGITFHDDGTFDGAYFAQSAIIPLELFAVELEDDGSERRYVNLYGLPETQSFSMIFYRADVFQQLGIELPTTWEELIAIIPTLQNNNMEIALPNSLGGLNLFLYQMGGDLYGKDGMTISFDDTGTNYTKGVDDIKYDPDKALYAFEYMCNFFAQYRAPYTYSFVNRFRTGEMPFGVVDYTTYTQLSVYATEIKGLWEFVPLPGYVTYGEDGTTIIGKNNTSVSGVSALIMLTDRTRTTEQTKNAWTFMKWYVGAENQAAYANELTALLGTVSKHNTANVEALASLSWTTSEYKNLMSQFTNLSAVREYPGGYIISRYVGFAFLAVYNDNDDPIESLLSYVTEINKELTRKRKEFGLKTVDDLPQIEEAVEP